MKEHLFFSSLSRQMDKSKYISQSVVLYINVNYCPTSMNEFSIISPTQMKGLRLYLLYGWEGWSSGKKQNKTKQPLPSKGVELASKPGVLTSKATWLFILPYERGVPCFQSQLRSHSCLHLLGFNHIYNNDLSLFLETVFYFPLSAQSWSPLSLNFYFLCAVKSFLISGWWMKMNCGVEVLAGLLERTLNFSRRIANWKERWARHCQRWEKIVEIRILKVIVI